MSVLLSVLLSVAPLAGGVDSPDPPTYTLRCDARQWPTEAQLARLLEGRGDTGSDEYRAQAELLRRHIRSEGVRACRAGVTHVEVRLPVAKPQPASRGRVALLPGGARATT